MPLKIKCPKCAKAFEILESAIGSSIACPHCKSRFRTVARKSASGSSVRKSASSDAGQASGSHQLTAGSEASMLLQCPACGEVISVADARSTVGRKVTCPSCGKVSLVGIHGFAGWLLLPAIGLVLSPLRNIWLLANVYDLSGFYAFSVLGIGFIAFQVFVAVVFFMKKPYAPKLMIALLLTNLALALLAAIISGAGEETAGALVLAAVWIPYFLVSKRVKATFGRKGVAHPIPEKDLQSGGSPATATSGQTQAEEGNVQGT